MATEAKLEAIRAGEPLRRQGPLVGWRFVEVLPDGRFDGFADRWPSDTYSVPACEGQHSDRVAAGTGFLRRPVVPAIHQAPAPGCGCGLTLDFAMPLRRFDRFRDRLGYRLGCLALVQVWGRIVVERDELRAEHARVLALVTATEVLEERRDRLALAADRYRTDVVEVDPKDFDLHAYLAAVRPTDSSIATRDVWADGRRTPGTRSWYRDLDGNDWNGLRLAAGVACVAASGAASIAYEAGAGEHLMVGVAVVALLLAHALALRPVWWRAAAIEAHAPPPDGHDGAGSNKLPVTLGSPRLGRLPIEFRRISG